MSCGGVAFLLIRLVASKAHRKAFKCQTRDGLQSSFPLSLSMFVVCPCPAATDPLKSIFMIPTIYRRLTGDLPTCILADLTRAIVQTPTAANGHSAFRCI